MKPFFTFKDRSFYIAFSGGKDSLAIAHWVKQRNFNCHGLVHVNHGLDIDEMIELKAVEAAGALGMSIKVLRAEGEPQGSLEAWCREQRYSLFEELKADILVCHHMGDAVEQYLLNCLKGCPEYLPIHFVTKRDGYEVFRPFLTTTASDIENYLQRFEIQGLVVDDPMNEDASKPRNYVRKVLMSQLDRFGLERVVRKKFYTRPHGATG